MWELFGWAVPPIFKGARLLKVQMPVRYVPNPVSSLLSANSLHALDLAADILPTELRVRSNNDSNVQEYVLSAKHVRSESETSVFLPPHKSVEISTPVTTSLISLPILAALPKDHF